MTNHITSNISVSMMVCMGYLCVVVAIMIWFFDSPYKRLEAERPISANPTPASAVVASEEPSSPTPFTRSSESSITKESTASSSISTNRPDTTDKNITKSDKENLLDNDSNQCNTEDIPVTPL